MKKKVIHYKALSPAQTARLSAAFDLEYVDVKAPGGEARLRERLPEAQGLLGSSFTLSSELLDLAPRLEAIASVSVGFDSYDLPELARRGILLCNTPDVLTESVADAAFSLLLASARRTVELANWVRAGQWRAGLGEAHFGCDVHGKTLGLVGMGRIGQAIARRASLGFGMHVNYTARTSKPLANERYGARFLPLHELLPACDFLCVTVPLSDETYHLLGAYELAQLPAHAIVVNVSRGPVLDEAALIAALQAGRLRGAGLDVFEREPLASDSPLLRLPNVVATPHSGSATHETREAMARCAVDNLLDALAGKRPANLVNPEVWQARC
ncbi:bifunctional glyoxylate/hydroxypyruvate reductase B [Pseudomonas sp. PA15(2017)]|uniref:2-hydroxyacid dehydrogenase n=1 Tax=Pseudomonas sp. PA15(2017) TaxID=1932111 RepID=UPI0009698CD3|nr:D-glycerate dehydrogenase [Pseudomonas sp. PA15(2017)]OLU33101.1 bifunctional glyoxylate/hydroxypyruvate reductase B [Pseudomonas sp. PA15(2017)]